MAHADGVDGARYVVHGVVDGHAGCDGATWGIYVEVYLLGGRVGFEEEELGGDHGGHGVVDLAIEGDDALGEEAGEDVGGFPAASLHY